MIKIANADLEVKKKENGALTSRLELAKSMAPNSASVPASPGGSQAEINRLKGDSTLDYCIIPMIAYAD